MKTLTIVVPIAVWLFAVSMFGLVWYRAATPETTQVAERIDYCDGSVLFWTDSLLVKPIIRHTGSDITHAAIILSVHGEPYVYEAVPPRVHCVPLANYLKEMEAKKQRRPEFSWFVVQPKVPYTPMQIEDMKFYAISQLGRPYAIRGYGKRVTRGIFCSALVSDILSKSGRIKSNSFRESPGSLCQRLQETYQ